MKLKKWIGPAIFIGFGIAGCYFGIVKPTNDIAALVCFLVSGAAFVIDGVANKRSSYLGY